MKRKANSLSAVLRSLMIGLALAVGFLPGGSVRAAGVRYAAPTAQGSGNCSNWANACTLQTAITIARNGDEIWVKAGVHYPGAAGNRSATFTLKSGVAIYGGFAGTETQRSQRNWRVNKTILSGDIDNASSPDAHGGDFINENASQIQGNNAYHVVTGSGTDNTAVLDGFIITAGQANSGSSPNSFGGGMYNNSGSPTVANLTFSGNTASSDGGGMYNDNSSPTLANLTFSGNHASSDGGGMYNDYSSPRLTDVIFSDNTASSDGGGMYNYKSSPKLTDVTFSGNTASDYGGGMFNLFSSPTLTNATFSGNHAAEGGGMSNYSQSSPTLTNVTFSGNTVTYYGGGMFNYFQSSPTLTNVILWGNTNGSIYNINSSAPIISYSDVQGCGGSGSGWNPACGTDGGGNLDANPSFVDGDGDDGTYGTADDNLRLQPTSPAIDTGNNTAVPSGVTTDLDGKMRIQDGNGDSTAIVDMGAYETDITAPTVSSIGRADPNPTSAGSVRFRVTFSEAVTGVGAGDFSLTTTGVSGAGVTGVVGSGAVYTVTVGTGSGAGTLRLDIPNTASITDGWGNPLAGLPYTNGEVYQVRWYLIYLPLVIKNTP